MTFGFRWSSWQYFNFQTACGFGFKARWWWQLMRKGNPQPQRVPFDDFSEFEQDGSLFVGLILDQAVTFVQTLQKDS
jgi:hypothetical protein